VNSLLHRDGDDDLDELNGTRDREITLGTTMILAIFFALAVLCAVFFGFGYQMGHKSMVIEPSATSSAAQSGNSFAGFKPAAGSLAGSTSAKSASQNPDQTVAVPYTPPPATVSPAPRPVPQATDEAAAAEPSAPAPVPAPVPHPLAVVATSAPVAAAAGSGAIVQVAAVSHQEDADLLVTTLKRRGYAVVVRTEPQDKLLHVQVGPFASHKDADAMRQKLLADGFNAIVKDIK
jgi:DedD protein